MDPFLGEIKICGFNFPPRGWALCNGQLLPINQNQALFSLLGTTYGGDGRTTFGLPDLRGRVPIHFNQGFPLGSKGGSETVTLTIAQMPAHNHLIMDNNGSANTIHPGGAVLATAANNVSLYASSPGGGQALNANSLLPYGSSQPHTNLEPYLTLNFIIALQGIYPTRS